MLNSNIEILGSQLTYKTRSPPFPFPAPTVYCRKQTAGHRPGLADRRAITIVVRTSLKHMDSPTNSYANGGPDPIRSKCDDHEPVHVQMPLNIPDVLLGEARRIRSRLTWFWQRLIHLSEEETEQLITICIYCKEDVEMRLDGPAEPLVTFCSKPCNLALLHLKCWVHLAHEQREVSTNKPTCNDLRCFSCGKISTPLISHLFSPDEKKIGAPLLDHLAICPWCRKFDQPIKHLLDCPELSVFFAGLSGGEGGDLLNQIPKLLNPPRAEYWEEFGVYELERREHKLERLIRVAGKTRRVILFLRPNSQSYDFSHTSRMMKAAIHIWSAIEEYLAPGSHPARRGEFIKLHSNILFLRTLGLTFPHQWCQGNAMCISLLSEESFAVFKIASDIVSLLTDKEWGLPNCIQDREDRTEKPRCLHCNTGLADYEQVVEHCLASNHTGRDLLTLSVLARRVRNSLRRPLGSDEVGRQLISQLPGLASQLNSRREAMRIALSRHPLSKNCQQ